jgi:hypothetical protein
MPWIIRLVKPPKINDFRDGFFPRKTHYKRDALELKREVEAKGGLATVEPYKKGSFT